MELYKLRYFLGVAQTENIHKAAAQLHASPSALSKAVASLEAELNVSLFERIGRNVRLTAAGRQLQLRATELLEFSDSIKSEIGAGVQIAATIAGREFLLASFGIRFVTHIEGWRQSTHVTLKDCAGADALAALTQGTADFALTIQPTPAHLTGKVIGQFEQRAAVAPAHPLYDRARRGVPIFIDEVLSHRFASPHRATFVQATGKQSIDGWRDDKFPRRIGWHIDSVELLGELMATGRAVGCVPDFWAAQRGFAPVTIPDCSYVCQTKVYLSVRQAERGSWCLDLFRKFKA